jgi:alanine-glyoxylate transaminase/serine-glyoxylate transaminase/serine-pyruvate transaminase
VQQILAEGMEARFRRHQVVSDAFKAAMTALELQQVPLRQDIAANTLTAVYYPGEVDAGLLGRVRKHGVVVAGGLHPRIRDRYFRVGHMGVVSASDVLATVGAIERALAESGYPVKEGAGLAAAQSILTAL